MRLSFFILKYRFYLTKKKHVINICQLNKKTRSALHIFSGKDETLDLARKDRVVVVILSMREGPLVRIV